MVLRASHTPLNFGDFERALGFSIGFDSMFNRLLGPSTQHVTNNQGYPPYNIRKDGETKYFIVVAVAGLSEDDLEVELKEGILSILSKQSEKKEDEYVHRGIARRMFERSFTLSDDIIVQGCGLVNGMLTVELEKVIPEDKKSRFIPIDNTWENTKVISEK